MTDAATLLALARHHKVMIATAESCTGGLVAGAITEIAGASEVFDRGFVTYSNAAKRDMLGVRAATLLRYGAVSPEVAREMAEGALARSAAGLAASVTGIAGPGGSDHNPEGRVCFGLAERGGSARAETVDFGPLGRSAVRAATVRHVLALLIGALRAREM